MDFDRRVDEEVAGLATHAFDAMLAEAGGPEELAGVRRSQVEGLLRLARQQPTHVASLARRQLDRSQRLADERRGPSPAVVFWRRVHEAVAPSPGPKAIALRPLATRVIEASNSPPTTAGEKKRAVEREVERMVGPFFQHFAALYLAKIERRHES